MRRSIIGTQNGFGLIEALIAMGLMAIVTLGLASVFEQVNNNQALMQAKMATTTFAQDVRTQLTIATLCKSSLTLPRLTNASTPVDVQVKLGATTAHAGSVLPEYAGITITSMRLENIALESTVATTNDKVFSGNLMVAAKSARDTFFKPVTALRLLITTSASGAFKTCTSAESLAASARICSHSRTASRFGSGGNQSTTCCNTSETSNCVSSGATQNNNLSVPGAIASPTTHFYICHCTPTI